MTEVRLPILRDEGHSPLLRGSTTDIDAEVAQLLPALERSQKGRFLAFTCGRRFESVALLAFHLHVWQPDALKWLGLNAVIAVLPFSSADMTAASTPLYRVGEARKRRRKARRSRVASQRAHPGDLINVDWEIGAAQPHVHLDHLVLSPSSFLSIQRVQADGSTTRSSRGPLGRHARRSAVCPRVLVPSKRATSAAAARVLAGADLLIADLQRVRGPRALRIIKRVLDSRSADMPTVLVGASASDLLAAGLDKALEPRALVQVGEPSPLKRVDLTLVAQDRLAADQRFYAAVEGLSEQSINASGLVAQAKNCWWTLRQLLGPEEADSELRRFERGLERLRAEDTFTAELFTACREVLRWTASDQAHRTERLLTTIQQVLAPGTTEAVLVLTKTWKSAKTLRAALAAELDLSIQDLEALGVSVSTVYSPMPPQPPGLVVLVGYAGLPSIDAALASGASGARAIFDPVETRAAWYGARRMADCLINLGAQHEVAPLSRFADGLYGQIAGFAPVHELELGRCPISLIEEDAYHTRSIRPATGEAAIILTDGTVLYVALGARFEVLGSSGLSSRFVTASELQSADQIVLIDEDSRLLFSEQRMTALDDGVLKEQSIARQAWIDIVRAVATMKQLTATAIANQMEARGYPVSTQTVRSWLEEPGKARAPIRFHGFLALAAVLGIELPEETLRHYYESIRRWRVRHRLAGRRLTQAIRLAQSGRLGATTQARIERDWGVEIRDLIEAARVVEVDDVIQSEETTESDK